MSETTVLDVVGALASGITFCQGAVLLRSLMGGDSYQFREIDQKNADEELCLIRSRLGMYIPSSQLRTLAQMREIFTASPGSYRILEHVRPGSKAVGEISGVAICYHLQKSFCQSLMSGSATAARISPDCLASDPEGFYVGFAWGANVKAQGYLCRALSNMWSGAGAVPLFTRPTTDEALKFVVKHGFQSFASSGRLEKFRICWRNAPMSFEKSRIQIQKII